MDPIDPEITARLPVVDVAPRVGEDAFIVPPVPLARGGMAEVYEVEDRRLPRNVILKRPRQDEHLDPLELSTFEARLEAEALVLARLQHPSIVTLHEVGRDRRGRPFCVLEKVSGRSLRSRLEELAEEEADGKPRTADRLELLTGLVGIVEAVAYAHERGIVHRDVTPNNILLGARGEMTLIDWGLAKDTRLGTGEATLARGLAAAGAGNNMTIGAGTPPYVSYEQTQGHPASPGYDVYSLGVTMYEVIAGRQPFRWEMPDDPADRQRVVQEFLTWARSGPAPDPAAPRDAELSGIIARAMARDPAERFTADELLLALRQYLTGELVFSHRYSVSGRLGRWVRRHRAVTLSAMIAMVAVVAATLSWMTLRARDAERARERARDEALVLAQKYEAAEAKNRATAAEQRAVEAEAAAARARAEGRESRALQAEAERLRKEALTESDRAKSAAEHAARDAGEAQAQWRAAMSERDAARKAQTDAEAARAAEQRARAAADQARGQAEADRDAARTAQAAAELARVQADRDREAALQARTAAESARSAAEQERAAALEARTAAEAARAAAEQERNAAQARIQALEARIRELEAASPPPPPSPPPG